MRTLFDQIRTWFHIFIAVVIITTGAAVCWKTVKFIWSLIV